jgi:hypothetical protein
MPPTTDPVSRNCLDKTIVWIRTHEKEQKEREALRTRTGRESWSGPSSSFSLRPRGNCRSLASSADLNRNTLSGLFLFMSSA